MNIHNKRFIVTLLCLLLIVIGAVLFIRKNTQTSSEDFADALISGAILSEKDCLMEAWGQERYDIIVSDRNAMTETERASFNICVNE